MRWLKILSITAAILQMLAALGIMKKKEGDIARGMGEIINKEIEKEKQ